MMKLQKYSLKYYLLLLLGFAIISISFACGGKGGDASLHVIVWKKNGYEQTTGTLSITFNTKDVDPKKSPNLFFEMKNGSGDLEDLKIGNYLVIFESSEIEKCATQFRINYEAEVVIVLREGEFIKQPH